MADINEEGSPLEQRVLTLRNRQIFISDPEGALPRQNVTTPHMQHDPVPAPSLSSVSRSSKSSVLSVARAHAVADAAAAATEAEYEKTIAKQQAELQTSIRILQAEKKAAVAQATADAYQQFIEEECVEGQCTSPHESSNDHAARFRARNVLDVEVTTHGPECRLSASLSPTNPPVDFTRDVNDTHRSRCSSHTETKLTPQKEQEVTFLLLQRQMLDVMNLPKTSLMTFEGDPIDYWIFMNSFDSIVGVSSVTDQAKLNRLFEYCKGKAAQVIKPCALMKPREGYARARTLLRERFGNDFVISEAWVAKVTEGVPLKPYDGEALQDFADDISACAETLRAMGKLNELDTRVRMVKLVQRLPLHLQARWRTKAVKVVERTRAYPDISDLVKFVGMAAKEANDPVYGTLNTKPPAGNSASYKQRVMLNVQAEEYTPSSQTDRNRGVKTNYTTSDRTPRRPCHCCGRDHRLATCLEFQRMPPERRMELVRGERLCFNCLDASNHVARWCRTKNDCDREGCTGMSRHSRWLHDALKPAVRPKTDVTSCACGPSDREVTKVALPIVRVNVRGKGQDCYFQTHALLDPGSNQTFCSTKLLKQLGLKGEEVTISLETLSKGDNPEAYAVSLEVTGTVGKKRNREVIQLSRVYALTKFPSLGSCLASPTEVKRWSYLKGVDLPQVQEPEVNLLIGQDVPQALVPLEVRQGSEGEPYATRTALGWTLNGPIGEELNGKAICNLVQVQARPDVELEAQVEQFWKIDTGHVLAGSQPQMSLDDRKAIKLWDRSLSIINGHYQMDIPFKTHPPELPDNRFLAEKRLHSLGRRLVKNPELYAKYKDGIENLLAQGYAETVPDDNFDPPLGGTWYLPHHNVVNRNKPDKFRIVFDCAAEYAGTSLNKKVLQGPDMTNKLIGVLVRFREKRVAVMGDIEAMFHQVKVTPAHRDALRFLWWRDGNLANQLEVYRMAVHLFGGVWSPSCANYALHRTADDHKDDFDAETITTVKENFYADDCLKSVDREIAAERLVNQLRQLLALGGFHLTKWVSNSRTVMASIPIEERAKGGKGLDLDIAALPVERALGVHWDTDADMLSINIKPKEKKTTRRGLLSIVSSVYDPLGFVSPCVLQAKMILQDECKRKKSWDDELDPRNLERWIKWLDELPELGNFRIPRCIVPCKFGMPTKVELHHFCDASMAAYGAVSYIRLTNAEESVHCSFLMGKSRLAPIKPLTIPRLELSAAVMAVRMDSILRREIRTKVHNITFWTDSMIVLQYIKNESKRFHTFVANRVAIIHDGSRPTQWRYINTKSNPADDASRGLGATQMLANERWKQGPEFLRREESSWQMGPIEFPDLLKDDKEVKREVKTCVANVEAPEDSFGKFLKRYSCWHRLRKAVAWLLRFKTWLLNHKRPESQLSLQLHELQAAETSIMLYLQTKHFGEERRAMMAHGRISKGSSICSLDPILVEGLLRISGRLQAAPLEERKKHPLIVPRDHHVTELIVRHYHEKSAHSGREHVLALAREKFWIPRARPLINRVLRGCVVCKRLKGKACSQRMANLPKDRVCPGEPPFTHTGVDCFGPFLVKKGRSQLKRYGCLFTCLTTRAIHIEKIDSLDADSFINALMRFAARRGMPASMRSDNGTNFVGGERELRESIQKWNQSDKVKHYTLLNEIQWQFNPPTASHMGGVWERQIRTVRKALNAIMKDRVLDDERLHTFFCEVESIVNGRPITPVSGNPKDMEALTPNHLLLLKGSQNAPPGKFIKQDMYGRRWRHVQLLADQFWKRWVQEYLPTLQLRRKWIKPQRNLVEGDIVLIMDESTPRGKWPLGRILRAFPGRDGLVRTAELKTRQNVLVRPVSKLCLLESQD